VKRALILNAFAAVLVLVPQQVFARDDSQLWTTATANLKLGGPWRFSQEVVARFSDQRSGLYEIVSNTLLGYNAAKGVTVAAGYTHDLNYSDGEVTSIERRAREQVTFDNVARIGRGKLTLRVRAEQRWRDHVEGTGCRFRPYVKYSLPLRAEGKTALILSSEPFVNLNTTSFQTRTGLDRVRNLIAISTPLTKSLTLEAGYLNQRTFVPNGRDSIAHAASLSLSFSR